MRYLLIFLFLLFLVAVVVLSGCTVHRYVVDKETGNTLEVHVVKGKSIILINYPPYNYQDEFIKLYPGDTILYRENLNRIEAVYIPTWRDPYYPRVRGAWMFFNYPDKHYYK